MWFGDRKARVVKEMLRADTKWAKGNFKLVASFTKKC